MGLIYDIQFPGLQAQQHLWRHNDQPEKQRGATANEGLVKRIGRFFSWSTKKGIQLVSLSVCKSLRKKKGHHHETAWGIDSI